MLQWPGDRRPHIKREEESQPFTIHTWHFKQTPRDLVFTNPHVPERFKGIVRPKRLPPQFPIQPEIHKTEDSWLSAWLAMRMASAYLNCSNALEHWNNRAGAKQNVTLTWSLTVCLKDSRKQRKTKKTPKTPLKLWRWTLENEMFHIQFPGKWCLCTSNIHFHPSCQKKQSHLNEPIWSTQRLQECLGASVDQRPPRDHCDPDGFGLTLSQGFHAVPVAGQHLSHMTYDHKQHVWCIKVNIHDINSIHNSYQPRYLVFGTAFYGPTHLDSKSLHPTWWWVVVQQYLVALVLLFVALALLLVLLLIN